MQAFVPRLYLTPVRDEEAESQRKAKSRHARQTRSHFLNILQGVTLTDLKEAQKTNSLTLQEREEEEEEEGGSLDDRSCLRKGLTDDRRVQTSHAEEATQISLKWRKLDEEGNVDPKLEILAESPNLSYLAAAASSCGVSYSNSSFSVGERWWKDENQNLVEDAAQLTFATKHQLRRQICEGTDCTAEVRGSLYAPLFSITQLQRDFSIYFVPLDGAKGLCNYYFFMTRFLRRTLTANDRLILKDPMGMPRVRP
ncbi:uncharacterized protein LOC125017940 [Mugil cephalus]|uniref:uncharacterized protein LOC125017940 n=1 Tax=Mugil cephalus TaxID=48193 RepID=UPI001FB6D94E|nr:uncharacterized protein LOC125017940 [Mugil cephalus]